MRARGLCPAALLLLVAACGCALAAELQEDQERCPGFFAPSENATRLEFTATIPEKHLETIFSPEQFSKILAGVVEGLDLQALTVVTNVSIGGYGETTEVVLSSPSGASLADPGLQYPWHGTAVLSLGAVTGPFFGLEAIRAMTGGNNQSERMAHTPVAAIRTSFDILRMPDPAPEALDLMRAFNAQKVAEAGGAPPMAGSVDEMSLYQVITCNGSELVLVYQDVDPLTAGLADDEVSLQDLKQREPELGMLFADAATSDMHLETSVPVVTRRQYWPLLLEDGSMAGFLMSSIEFATQRDAVAGKDAIRGTMRVVTTTDQSTFQPYYADLPEEALQDIQLLMTALQKDL